MRQLFAIAFLSLLVGSGPSLAQDDGASAVPPAVQSASDYNKELLTIEEDVNSL